MVLGSKMEQKWCQKPSKTHVKKTTIFGSGFFGPKRASEGSKGGHGRDLGPLAGTGSSGKSKPVGPEHEVLGARGLILNNTIKDSWVSGMRISQGPLTALKMLSGDCMKCRPYKRSETQAGRDLTRRVAAAGCAADSWGCAQAAAQRG